MLVGTSDDGPLFECKAGALEDLLFSGVGRKKPQAHGFPLLHRHGQVATDLAGRTDHYEMTDRIGEVNG